ncbi:charged multivesicular body protein 7 [Neltuma alba]|uniref:charged multivesicular body protein 7 n=1 Tax=Neltuma alba TaxID=207710 RepID=UPI0010A4FC9C|nr:charged multivesicular body protein 7 [Prosopis alba]XP_028791393.1 charged multivesicular body protein 7 [Prosopis alba]XP_028792365.1 charged multivesicular body protein 7-like [Prosopis alba]
MNSKRMTVKDFILSEVPDWDDEVVASARFKAFSGQRSDWQSKFLFWRDLIIKIARHVGLFIIRPSEVKNDWFNRGGLTPLCLDHVLFLMYNEGDITRTADLVDPTSGRLSQLFRKVSNLITRSTTTQEIISEEPFILTMLLKDKAAEVIKLLSESHWNSSCIVTMKKFQEVCGGPDEKSAILGYLGGCGKAQYISVRKKELVEGIKISLSTSALSHISNLDYDILHLIWTTERLQQQLDMIDQRYELSRQSALTSLHSGKRKLALRYARELKLATQSREKCSSLLNRVEEVLRVIADAESTKKVSEAVELGARAMKENKISAEEVDVCLRDIQESIDSQKEVEKALERSPAYTDLDEEDIEEEFKRLELAVGNETGVPEPENAFTDREGKETSEAAEFINDAFSNLKLSDDLAESKLEKESKIPEMEAA